MKRLVSGPESESSNERLKPAAVAPALPPPPPVGVLPPPPVLFVCCVLGCILAAI